MDRQRESGEQKDSAPPRSNGKESMPSRIAASASGLAKDLLSSASADEARSAFASGSGLSSKLQSGSGAAGPSTWSQALPARQNGSSSSSHASSANGVFAGPAEGFRERGASELNLDFPDQSVLEDFDFDTFLHGDEFVPIRPRDADEALANGMHPNGTEENEERANSNQLHSQWTQEFQNSQYQNEFHSGEKTAFEHFREDDGAEIFRMLSDPTFSTDGPADVEMADPTADTVKDLFGEDFSAEEKEMANKIKSSLPAPPQHKGVSPDNPLNLRPEFASSNPHLEQEIRELSSTLGSGQDILAFSGDAQQHLLSEWDDVLNSYTDEVWGDMLPVVKAARSQLEEVKAGMDRLDNKAVARLRMILGHVVDTTQASSTATFSAQAQSAAQQQAQHPGMEDLRQLHRPVHDYAVQQPFQQPYQQPHRQPVHEQRHEQKQDEQRSEDDSDIEVPTFHCPYVSCHERFHNERELRMHSREHTSFTCPHFDCAERFEKHAEWAGHINRAHHGLLETPPAEQDDTEA